MKHMSRVITLTAGMQAPSLYKAIAHLWQGLKDALFDPYRPELHYMRGPGPKWREKHAQES
jgi:hypothetical protein